MDLHHQARVLQIDKALDVSPSKFDKDNLKKTLLLHIYNV